MESESYRYRMEMAADDSVIDELGHVSNLAYIEWALEAAKAHSIAVGYDPRDYAARGTAFVVRRHEIDYHRPVLKGQRVEVSTWIDSFSSASSTRRTELRLLDEPDAPLVCSVQTQWVFAALPSGRPRRIPTALKEAYQRFRG